MSRGRITKYDINHYILRLLKLSA